MLHILSNTEKYYQYDPDDNECTEIHLKTKHHFDSKQLLLFNQRTHELYILSE